MDAERVACDVPGDDQCFPVTVGFFQARDLIRAAVDVDDGVHAMFEIRFCNTVPAVRPRSVRDNGLPDRAFRVTETNFDPC